MTIEDVPFRRQDRRILNSRKKRVILRHMYKCSCIMALILLMAGSALVTLYILFINGEFIIFKKLLGQDIWDKKLAHIFLLMPKKKNLFPTIHFCLKWFVFWAGSGLDQTRGDLKFFYYYAKKGEFIPNNLFLSHMIRH